MKGSTSEDKDQQQNIDTNNDQQNIESTNDENLAAAETAVKFTDDTTTSFDIDNVSSKRQQYSQTTFQQRAGRRRGIGRGFSIPSTIDEINHAESKWPEESWQLKALTICNSHIVQKILVVLLLFDVLILFTELAIDVFFPYCMYVVRDAISCCPADSSSNKVDGLVDDGGSDVHRLLAADNGHDNVCIYPLIETTYQAGCDDHKWHGVHVAHEVLFWMTIVILITFEFELLLMLYLLGKKFWSSCFYVVDFFIVSISLILELLFHWANMYEYEVLPGVLIFFRLWRFVRIGHGLVASTYEIEEHRHMQAELYIDEIEGLLKKTGCTNLPERPEHLKKEEE